MKTKSELWLEYARLHPAEFSDYRGYCRCNWCKQYRDAANEWIELQMAKSAEPEN